MHLFRYRSGKLHSEQIDLEKVAEQFGTPLYVYSAGTVRDHYQRLSQALSPLSHLICYAVKANSNGAILSLLKKEGAGFDIVSGGELYRVLQAGGDPKQCTFAGVGKSREEIEFALEKGVLSFNVESEAELDYINRIAADKKARAPVALRVNPDVAAHTHKYISTGTRENKFGIALDRIHAAYERAASFSHLQVVGLQMHIGSQITETQPFVEAIEKVTPLARELKTRFQLKFFSIGGGMGIEYASSLASGSGDWWATRREAGEAHPRTLAEYAAAIVPALRDLDLPILLEPGRFLVGNAGVLLTRVRYIKESGQKKFVIVDAGMNDLIRPALYGSFHEIIPVAEPADAAREAIDVVGPVCESADFFALDRELPPVREGDLLALMSAGAYGMVMASNYNSRPLPAEVLIDGDKFALIRKRQDWKDLVRDEIVPESCHGEPVQRRT